MIFTWRFFRLLLCIFEELMPYILQSALSLPHCTQLGWRTKSLQFLPKFELYFFKAFPWHLGLDVLKHQYFLKGQWSLFLVMIKEVILQSLIVKYEQLFLEIELEISSGWFLNILKLSSLTLLLILLLKQFSLHDQVRN